LINRLQQLSFIQEISLLEYFADSLFVAKLVGYCKKPACLVLKYYSIGSLDSFIESNKSTFISSHKIKLTVLKDICQGINVLHARQVAHCDLKPQNVLVEELSTGVHCVLTDFGISKILSEENLASELFLIRNLRGLTVPYAAPETLRNFRHKIVIRNPNEEKAGDIYAFSMIVYFVSTQLSPWIL
jgi:serine/threonine protein kinase